MSIPILLLCIVVSLTPQGTSLRMSIGSHGQPRACLRNVQSYGTEVFDRNCGMDLSLQQLIKTNLWPFTVDESMHDCPVFYLHSNGAYPQMNRRNENVQAMKELDPSIRVMSPILWRSHYDAMKKAFAALRIPICFWDYQVCGRPLPKGPLARFASAIFAAIYQIQFNLPCMVIMEDDVHLPHDFRHRFSEVHMPQGEPIMYKFGQWGEGYASNLKGANRFLERVYKYGVVRAHDWFVMEMCKDFTKRVDVGVKLLVETNGGDIKTTDEDMPPASDFEYAASHDYDCARVGLDAFADESETDLAVVMMKVADKEPSCNM